MTSIIDMFRSIPAGKVAQGMYFFYSNSIGREIDHQTSHKFYGGLRLLCAIPASIVKQVATGRVLVHNRSMHKACLRSGAFIGATFHTFHKSPLVYVYLLLLVCWICLSFQWLIARRRAALVAEIGASKRIASIIAAGILGNVAYLMVLAALRITPVSYVAPVREVSVVMGAWIGTRFMGEQV